ncbi:MAG TPA: DNA-binding response regulator [Marinilabiliales bacterium]|jgi:two-component system LytT family response regulator|nr:LytTR family DNA-binding domain-containing protein [Salinivirgaceae bacterium]OFX49633.1 MAG: DNA-binding response regulator [Bacteroidetes bacterium GWA2_40_14]OFX62238.1 MAG: DNA-binding response regulator [Bacteroidetes bacterium GWC2_40_13]OFX73794.1 MAG: DNA-binding response regulator [Bacteroidetes bacterium GWD2_40_43]OFX89422.1 MAG: DNA-binding response regulator [Bacteroidetes bacterium GWE2_40_63]OFY23248.1 MAG: DNA-binding response regulator [Bacteroidetes bacterium GWF2_40_13]O
MDSLLRCLAIDDEPLALKQIANYIEKTPFLELVTTCESPLEALDVLNKEVIDLMFVDINMPDLNGLDFVKLLEKHPLVVFTTAHSEYAIEGFKVDALDYLLKPIGYADFVKAAHKAKHFFELEQTHVKEEIRSNQEYLFIKSEYKIVRINFSDIKYIEGMREYVRIFTENNKPVMSLMSMKSIEAMLPPSDFMRVHRSFIVNLNKVTTIERQRIIFDGKTYVPISEQYKDKFQAFIDKNFI